MGSLKTEEVSTVLIIGIAGGLAQILAKLISKEYPNAQIVGVDSRPLGKIRIPNTTFKTFRYSRGNFEKLFREHRFDLVYHLGRISHANTGGNLTLAKRLDLNIMGTSRILDLCLKHHIKKIVMLSTFHVYGALPDNPAFVAEEASLRASINYPELRDVVEMDQLTTSWMWKNQNHIKTVVLRPCNIVGSQIKNAISKYLMSPWSPTPIDYNPMFQFIHEFDMARVLVKCIELVPTGIYNVSPHEFISLKEAREIIGTKGIPCSMFLLGNLAGLYKRFNSTLPNYLLDYLRYSCLIDPHEISLFLGKDFCRFKAKDTLDLLRLN